MNRLRIFAIATALIAGSSALATAQDHDRDRDRHNNGYAYRNGGYYNDHDRDDRWRGNHDRRWRRDDDDRRIRGWWNRGRDRD